MNIWLLRLINLLCGIALVSFVVDWLPQEVMSQPLPHSTNISVTNQIAGVWPQVQLPLLLLSLLTLLWLRLSRHKLSH